MSDVLPTRGRLLAVDLGEVRVGLAVSDPDQLVASPAETVDVPRDSGVPALVRRIGDAATAYEPVGLVVGYPKDLSGREGPAAARARRVADGLRETTGLPVVLWDERFSTVEAERVMLAQDASRATRRRDIDRVAASLILQGVLESQRTRR
ncbi:MAG: Holliday junction resolvase RuvX [Actinomycetes bacterium]